MDANSRISEGAVESTGEREAEILTADDRMSADRGLEPKLMNPEREGEKPSLMFAYVRLYSPMFAYVRLIREKLLRGLRAATWERGKRANFKFLTVRSLISAWTGGGYGNARNDERAKPVRNDRQSSQSRRIRASTGGNRGNRGEQRPINLFDRNGT